ncbi:segregation/condensation protein A [Periweissella cryptocerci]|uniref:Segregation and condensation protein A n=1 Tax=Periweissella cryptocerci TaxID=2506420 RepID=A0A4P6YR19_9LACO|nr:segregation/condensation protein A [Periweissella cryptocerci]QBO35054.1 segregation/condensation protein A [Periweissella cryptocerci]
MPNELQIKLTDFEGPLDLLLHLIKSAEMDIYDIPIVEITEQYMTFLHEQQLSLDIAGEYLVMAASLMQIKSRYLLPQQPTFDETTGDEVYEDPRQQLVDQLLEYRQYQDAASKLHEREAARQQQFSRAPMSVPADLDLEIVAPGVQLDDLHHAFMAMLQRNHDNRPIATTVQAENFTIAEKTALILHHLQANPDGFTFTSLFANDRTADEMVTTFLAILEMTKHHKLQLQQTTDGGEITIFEGDHEDFDMDDDEAENN